MELFQLRSFQAVAQTGNLTRAAEALHLSQSALSVQIRNLEDELGVELFARQAKGMRLTAVDDPAARAQVQARLDAYQRGNHALLQHHRLMAAPSPLQAYDPAQVEQRPEPVPASQALPGLGVEDVSLQPGPATVRLQATFIIGDATPSAWFVPLAVLVVEQGN